MALDMILDHELELVDCEGNKAKFEIGKTISWKLVGCDNYLISYRIEKLEREPYTVDADEGGPQVLLMVDGTLVKVPGLTYRDRYQEGCNNRQSTLSFQEQFTENCLLVQ